MSEGERLLPYIWQGDLYEVYHIEGEVTRIFVAYGNVNATPLRISMTDLPLELQHKILDRLHLNR